MNLSNLTTSPTFISPDDFLDLVLAKRKARHTYIAHPKITNSRKARPRKIDYSKWPIAKQLALLAELNKETNHTE